MATRSSISLRVDETTFKTIYCHWDGYISNNGKLLKENYNTEEKVKELIELGDISSLRERVKPNEGEVHNFDNPLNDVVIAYGRDRGEENVSARTHMIYIPQSDLQEYNYLFEDGVWKVSRYENRNFEEFTIEE